MSDEYGALDEMDFARKFVQTYRNGELVFQEGQSGNEMYAVIAGRVDILRVAPDGAETLLTTLAKGDVFGEMALVECVPRSATARAAADDTRLVVIDQAKFVYLVTQQPVFALNMMQVLCQRIRSLEKRLAKE